MARAFVATAATAAKRLPAEGAARHGSVDCAVGESGLYGHNTKHSTAVHAVGVYPIVGSVVLSHVLHARVAAGAYKFFGAVE